MRILELVELAVQPCGDCPLVESLRTRCVFGFPQYSSLPSSAVVFQLRGVFMRECQESNVYCQADHVDSLDMFKPVV